MGGGGQRQDKMIGVAARLLLSFRSWKREIRRFDVSNKKERRGAKREGKLQKNETPACLRCPFPFPLSLSLSLFFSSKPLSLSVPLPLPSLLYNLSHRVLARPLAGRLLVPRPVRLVDVRDLRHQGVIGVRVAQQRADREQHFRQRQGGRPLLLEDVEADGALGVDVGVVDLGGGERRRRGFWDSGKKVKEAEVSKKKKRKRKKKKSFFPSYLGLELDLRGLERVVRREVDHDEEDAACVGGVGGSHDGCLRGMGFGEKEREEKVFFFPRSRVESDRGGGGELDGDRQKRPRSSFVLSGLLFPLDWRGAQCNVGSTLEGAKSRAGQQKRAWSREKR